MTKNGRREGLKCLWLGRVIPLPLNDGARIYSAKLVAALAGQGVAVTYLGLANPDVPEAPDLSLLSPEVEWRIVAGAPRPLLPSLLSRAPLVAARFDTKAYRDEVEALLREDWDAVVLDQYAMVWVLDLLKTMGSQRPFTIHVAHDFETHVTRAIADDYPRWDAKRVALFLNAAKTARAERALAAGSEALVLLTEEDAASFRAIRPDLRFVLAPPGYDGERKAGDALATSERTICILGSYQWMAKQMNLERFVREADAVLSAAGVRVDVIGSAPPEFVARLEEGQKAFRFVGFVPDLASALARYRMGLVVEETGGGFKLKVLDYIFNRLPVAALDGSCRGLPKSVLDTFTLARGGDALARAIVETIDDVEGLRRRQDTAFQVAEQLFDWSENGRRLKAMIASARV